MTAETRSLSPLHSAVVGNKIQSQLAEPVACRRIIYLITAHRPPSTPYIRVFTGQ